MNPSVRTQNSNTPSIQSSATAVASNKARVGMSIQNIGTNPLFVLLGSGATTSVFHYILKGCSVQDDGTGGILTMSDTAVYTGIVTIAGTSPRYVVAELAP